MEKKQKYTGDFASAYKLSGLSIDKKASRRQRKSIEQKELRHNYFGRQRKLVDLSPLQEGEASSTSSTYKNKTPIKTGGNVKKGLDRLEQLKKWKEDRNRKRREETEANKKSVFRVSKVVDHKDANIFLKGVCMEKSRPVKTVSNANEKMPAPQAKPKSEPAKSSGGSNDSTSRTLRNKSDKHNAIGTKNASKDTTIKTKALKDQVVKLPMAAPPTARITRASAKADTLQSTRITRQSARNATSTPFEKKSNVKAVNTKKSKPAPVCHMDTLRCVTKLGEKDASPSEEHIDITTCVTKLEENDISASEDHIGNIDITRVTRRGQIDISADTFVFGDGAAHRFSFEPLSPISATGVFCRSMINSCSSFLEANSNRLDAQTKEVSELESTLKQEQDKTLANCLDNKQLDNTLNQSSVKIMAAPGEKPAPSSGVRKSKRLSVRQSRNTGKRSIIVADGAEVCEPDMLKSDNCLTEELPLKTNVISVDNTEGDCSTSSDKELGLPFAINKTPARKLRNTPRNKSFGGLRSQGTDSVKLSCQKRFHRKSMLPKSPEEWVELLSNSPMIEMTRRTPRIGNITLPVLEFDLEGTDNTVTAHEAMETNSQSSSASVVVDQRIASPVPSKTEDMSVSDVIQEEFSVPYFRQLLSTEIQRLQDLCVQWEDVNSGTELTEEVSGQIRTAVCLAKLLIGQKFRQFSGLIDDCEFKTGEKETTCTDLKGFWDMTNIAVEDIDKKFANLTKLKANNWVDDSVKPIIQKAKKVKKTSVIKPVGKSKFSQFRNQMLKQKEAPDAVAVKEEKVFEVPAFFSVTSPVLKHLPHCEGGTPKKPNVSPSATSSTDKPEVKVSSVSNDITMPVCRFRRSFVPCVPSPLLVDITPSMSGPTRMRTRKAPLQPLIDEVQLSTEQSKIVCESASIATPRRSLRIRRSVNFTGSLNKEDSTSPDIFVTSQEDFIRLLQPTAQCQETEKSNNVANDSFSVYLQPSVSRRTSVEKGNSPRHTSRCTELKSCRSSERRSSHSSKRRRTSGRSDNISKVSFEDNVFSLNNLQKENKMHIKTFQSPRPSLLGTPPDLRRCLRIVKDVPTATLISFSP